MTRRDYMILMGGLAQTLPPAPSAEAVPDPDRRNIANGYRILSDGYSDQPYVVITDDGNWLCVVTTGTGKEGDRGQHIVSTISADKGKTWSAPVDIEPAGGPEASWVIPLKVPGGRVYVFYTYNKNNVRQIQANPPSYGKRVDTLGVFAYKYSDDNGRTWSRQRYEIPMRAMRIDRENGQDGILLFWSVSKPIIYQHRGRQAAMFGFAKVGRWGAPGVLVTSQGCFIRSENILTEKDPAKIKFEMLPDGDEGLRAPKGPISEEANLTYLSNGSLYATYRTIDGYNCHAYSHDDGHTWTPPAYGTYTPGGQLVKHPRAANFVWRTSNGKFLMWFHNQGGEAVHAQKWDFYRGRNPAWLAGGVEKNGKIYWSQPEILLYDEALEPGISYPDLIEDHGRYFVTETQKATARVHEIDPVLLEGMWNQATRREVVRRGLVLDLDADRLTNGSTIPMPRLPLLQERRGFSMDFWIRMTELTRGQAVLDARGADGRGIALTTSDRYSLNLTMHDGEHTASWDSDPGTHPGTLKVGVWQHVAVIVDGGPRIITFVVDGICNDGGAVRQYGWGRFSGDLADVNGSSTAQIAPALFGSVRKLRMYDRYLRTSEAISNFRAGV